VDTIIVATGADVLKPAGMYCYGENKNVITQLEFERLLKERKLERLKSIAMIQCVGAREEREGGRNYCSRICCAVAVKNALQIKFSPLQVGINTSYSMASFMLGPSQFPMSYLLDFIVAVVVMVVFREFLRRTYIGRAITADQYGLEDKRRLELTLEKSVQFGHGREDRPYLIRHEGPPTPR
jgi:hypothetical protein